MCLAIPGVANQLETNSLVSYCVTARSHVMHTGAHEQDPISSCLTHIYWARFIANITNHQQDNDRTLQGIYCYACYLMGLLVYNYVRAA